MTGKLYGPFDQADWLTLKMLKSNIAWMKETDAEKYGRAIAKDTRILKKYINGEIKEAA